MTPEYKQKIAAQNAHIDSEVIQKDILDTQSEIDTMRKEIAGYRLIGDRLSELRITYREDGIAKRQQFIEQLLAILEVRSGLLAPVTTLPSVQQSDGERPSD